MDMTQCNRADAKRHYKLTKDGECVVFLLLWNDFQPFFLKCPCDQKNRRSDFKLNGRTFSNEPK